MRSLPVVVLVLGEPLTVVVLGSVGRSNDEAPGVTRLRKRVTQGAPVGSRSTAK